MSTGIQLFSESQLNALVSVANSETHHSQLDLTRLAVVRYDMLFGHPQPNCRGYQQGYSVQSMQDLGVFVGRSAGPLWD